MLTDNSTFRCCMYGFLALSVCWMLSTPVQAEDDLANVDEQPRAGETRTFDGIEFVYIPSGTFTIEDPLVGIDENRDRILGTVTISKGFWMSQYEVTQSQWESQMGTNPSKTKASKNPVDQVSWNDVQGYLKKIGTHYRLPTEAEWEYAARAGNRSTHGISSFALDRYAWYENNSGEKTHPVGQKKPNAWGLYDMQGNVWEWCSDGYGDFPDGSVIDPQGESSSKYKVMRGSSCFVFDRDYRSALRFYNAPDDGYLDLGFRIVRTL